MTNPHEIKAAVGVDLPRVRALVAPVLAARGVSLADLEWLTDRSGWVLRLTIERVGRHAPGTEAVTLEDCAVVSRDASAVLDAPDVEDLFPHRYHLEVSSPGLDRPLRAPGDFVRFAGEGAKVKLARPAPDGQKVLRGVIAEAPEGRVAMVVDGKRIEVAFADVAEANLVFELKPQAKPGSKPGSKPKGPRREGASRGRGARSS